MSRHKYDSFILIENPLSPDFHIDYMRLLGASQSRGRDDQINQFGSGFIFSLALMAREGILDGLKIAIDRDVFTFETIKRTGSGLEEIQLRQQNAGTIPLNVNTDYGVVDWTDVSMACREFISNALDATYRINDSYDGFNIELIETAGKQRPTRARAGTVRVYLPGIPEFIHYYEMRHEYFPCMAPGWDRNQRIWNNTTVDGTAKLYRRGALVHSNYHKSLFCYNVNDITINEARKVDTGAAREAAAKVICQANVPMLVRFLKNVSDPTHDYFERYLDYYYLNPDNWLSGNDKERALANWKRAYEIAFGPSVVVVDSDFARDAATSKGYDTVQLPDNITPALKAAGANTADKVLTKDELSGRVTEPAPGWLAQTFDEVWGRAQQFGMTRNRATPTIRIFKVDDSSNDNYKDVIVDRDEGAISLNHKYIEDEDASREIVTQALGFYCTKASYLESGAVARWVAKLALQLMRHPLTIDAAHTNELPAPEPVDLEPSPYDYV